MAVGKILLDTSLIVDLIRRKDRQNSYLAKVSNEYLYISILTHTELYSGKSVWEKDYAQKELKSILSEISIIALDEKISQKAGFIKAHNPNIDLIDCIIAATAITEDLELATLNTKDFKTIKDLRIYNLS